MSKPNLANTEVLDSCPQCNGPIILIGDEWACSNCGFRLLTYFDPEKVLERAKEFHMKLRKRIEESEGGKCPEVYSSRFFEEGCLTSHMSASGQPKPAVSGHVAGIGDPEFDSVQDHRKVLEGLGEEDSAPLPSPISGRCSLPGPLAPFILTEHELRRLMKEDCSLDDGLGEQRYLERPTSPSPFSGWPIGYPSETQQKLCKFYDVGTHICKEDRTAWCLNPAAPICWTRIDGERAKKGWPVYKGSQWKNNAECPVCGAKVNYEIASCETGCNYCCDEHATQHVKEETPEGGW